LSQLALDPTPLVRRPLAAAASGTRRHRRGLGGYGWTGIGLAIAVVIATPVLFIVSSLGFAKSEIWHHLIDTVLADYVVNSLLLMVAVGFGVIVIGAGTAWAVTMCDFPGRRWLQWALLLPLAAPAYVLAYVYTDLLDYSGPVQTLLRDVTGWRSARDYWFPEVRSLPGAALMLTLALYPYVYLMTRAALLQQCVCVLEVSRTLGCTPWQAFIRVGAPLARPAIAGGTALALMETLNDYGTVQYFGVPTFTTGIYRTWFGFGDPMAAAQLGTVLVLFVLVLLLLERWSRRAASYQHATARYRTLRPLELGPVQRWLMAGLCLLPILLGFAIPSGSLVLRALDDFSAFADPAFLNAAWASLILAGVTAVVAVAVALLLAYGKRQRPSRTLGVATSVATMGYAAPGSVIAVGVLVPLTLLDNLIDGFARDRFGVSLGLLFTGGIAALVFAYLVRFLAVAHSAVDSSLGKVRPSFDGAASTLGHGSLARLFRVHIPMIAPGMLSAAILVFVDVMKELPATIIIRPFNFDTLAVRTYRLASEERLDESAGYALAIIVVGLLPVIVLSRLMAKARPGDRMPEP
jgi:iron(III) transport system permease protein